MDPVKLEKLQAMKRYRRNKQFLPRLIQYVHSTLLLGLFLSSPLWLPIMCSNLKAFFFVSLPKMWKMVFRPKCLFVVCNVIIIFLVGESKLSKTSTMPDIYEEYVEQQKSLRRLCRVEAKEENNVPEKALVEEREEKDEDVEEEAEERGGGGEEGVQPEYKDLECVGKEGVRPESKELKCVEEEEGVLEGEDEDLDEGEEERGLPADELNKRVEEFIAKFNMERRLEARMLVCYG